MASKSSNTIRPVWPKDLSSILQEGEAHHQAGDAGFTPGTVVFRDTNNRLVRADAGDANQTDAPLEVVWTDGVNRADATVNHVNGGAGVTVKRYTTLCGPVIFDLLASAAGSASASFVAPGNAGLTPFAVVANATTGVASDAGKIEVKTAAVSGFTLGKVQPSPLGADWVRIKVTG